MRICVSSTIICLSLTALTTSRSFAQAPPEPHKNVKVAASAGLALTSGNADTSNVNASFDLTFDPQTRNIVKSDALYLRGENEGSLSADRLNWNIRDQYRITARAYVFGQNQYLRDSFKNIDYLLAPSGGLGYKVVDLPGTRLDVDAGLGGVWEKNPGLENAASGAVTFGEKFSQRLTATTTMTQSFAGLWKTRDFDDALYTFGVGIAAAISTRTQLKVELLDVYKSRPPLATIQKNDLATIVAIVFKN